MLEKRETLEQWRKEIKSEIEDLEQQLKPLLSAMQSRKEQLAAIEQLMSSLDPDNPQGEAGTNVGGQIVINSLRSLAEAAQEVLEKEHAPLHYQEIARRMQRIGVTIPGENPEANLIAHMSRDDRFTRVARGTYALSSWNLKPKQRKSRTRRKKR